MIEVVFDFSQPPDFIAVESRRQISPAVTRLGVSSRWDVTVFKMVGSCMRHDKC